MVFIGGLDITNLKHAFFFNSWSKGNGTVDKRLGNQPSFPGGTYQPCAFTNCGIGEGYLFNAGDGHFHPNGVNAWIASTLNILHTAVSKLSIETWFLRNVGVFSNLAGAIDDINNFYSVFVYSDVPKARLSFTFKGSGVTHRAISTTATGAAAGFNHLVAIKDGVTIKLVLNGVEVAYSAQDAYGHGNFSLTDNLTCGIKTGILQPCRDDIYAQLIYDDALTTAHCLTNYNLGRDYGLIGNNVLDVMNLTTPGSWHLLNKRNELAYNSSQLR